MLAVVISWIVISFVLISFGDMLVHLYSKLCKKNERYSILDTFILGMCFTLIPLSLSSFWLPSNHYILFAYIALSIIYWFFNKNRFNKISKLLKENISSLTTVQKALFAVSILSVMAYVLWSGSFYDAAYYHYQNIRWNEEYPVIPGLGNIEDRFAFNSNYLLLSAVFSFRFLFGEPVYMLQSLLFTLILCWAMKGVFKSNYNIVNLILLFLCLLLFIVNGEGLSDSSTDIIPNLTIFYLLTRIVLHPDAYKKQSLLWVVLPATLITFKLSTFIFCGVSLFALIYLARKREIKTIGFLFSVSSFIVILWFIRNIIVSGYLVYPVYQIDLFSFDWKMPLGSTMLENVHITEWAIYISKMNRYKLQNLPFLIPVLSCLFVALSPAVILYSIRKKKKIHSSLYLYYLLSLLNGIVWYLSARDYRFINGCALGTTFLVLYIILSFGGLEKKNFMKAGYFISISITICFVVIAVQRNQDSYKTYKTHTENHIQTTGSEKGHCPQNILLLPYPTFYLKAETREHYIQNAEVYKMGNIEFYLTERDGAETFDILCCTSNKGLPFNPFNGGKIQSIRTIELRGKRIEDGFRTQKEYINVMNNNFPAYKQKYIRLRYTE